MKTTIQFSIIIPTLNSEAHLDACLKSIETQHYKAFEVIIIDGVSKDKTLTIAKKYSAKFEHFELISEKDQGIYDAMNRGIQIAKGDWLYFLGSDDTFYNKDVLATINDRIRNSVDIIYGNVMSEHHGGIYDGKFTFEKLCKKNICHQAIFFNRKVFKKIGLFEEKYKVAADWTHNIKWFFNNSIHHKYIDEIIANFRDGGYSIVNDDHVFEKDKNQILLKLGFWKLSFRTLKKFCKTEISIAEANRNYLKILYYKTYLNLIKLRLKFNPNFNMVK